MKKYFLDKKKSLNGYFWNIRDYDERLALAIYQKFGVSEIVSRLLALREIPLEKVNNYLNPTLRNDLPNPFSFLDMEKGVDIIYKTIINNKKICIFGDYDVDGITSSALMKRFFSSIGIDVENYIPDRIDEGYGPNISAFINLKENKKIDTIITVDCGISAFDVVNKANEIGLNVVITDHHISSEDLPKALAIINPNRFDEKTEYKNLAGVGVAFLFCVALNKKLRESGYYKNKEEPDLIDLLDLVAFGTICDLVPLVTINRTLVTQGLKIAKNRNNTGIRALADVSNLEECLNTYHVGYILGPRINASGRVANASSALQLLTTENEPEAREIAIKLDYYNKERQEIERKVTLEAIEKIEKNEIFRDCCIFVEGKDWHEGVIGIVASRIKEKYDKPSFVISILGDCAKCSCRSVHNVNVGDAIIEAKIEGIIDGGGGHSMAGGFNFKVEKLEEVKNFFQKKLKKQVIDYTENKELDASLILECKSLSLDMAKEIEKLGPYGVGNPKPRIILKNVVIVRFDLIGKDRNTLRCIVADDHINALNSGIMAMCFGVVENSDMFNYLTKRGSKLNLIGEVNVNRWCGKEDLQFIIEDIML